MGSPSKMRRKVKDVAEAKVEIEMKEEEEEVEADLEEEEDGAEDPGQEVETGRADKGQDLTIEDAVGAVIGGIEVEIEEIGAETEEREVTEVGIGNSGNVTGIGSERGRWK